MFSDCFLEKYSLFDLNPTCKNSQIIRAQDKRKCGKFVSSNIEVSSFYSQ